MELYYIGLMHGSIIFFWSLRIALFRHSGRLYTHISIHTLIHTKYTLFALFVDFMETKSFRTSWLSPIFKDDRKCPVSVIVIQHTHIQHRTRNVNLDSFCQGGNIACNCSVLGFQFPATGRNIDKVNSFIYSGSDTSLLWEYMRIQALEIMVLEIGLK